MTTHSSPNFQLPDEFYSLISEFSQDGNSPNMPLDSDENSSPQHSSEKSQFIENHLSTITNNLLARFQKQLDHMNQKGIFDAETNKMRLLHKMREQMKRIEWDQERLKAEQLWSERQLDDISAVDVLDRYLQPDRTKHSIKNTSEAFQWRRDSVFLMGKYQKEYKRIMKEDEKNLRESSMASKRKVPKYMQQTLKRIAQPSSRESGMASSSAPATDHHTYPSVRDSARKEKKSMHTFIREVSRAKILQSRFHNSRRASKLAKFKKNIKRASASSEESYERKRNKLEKQLNQLKESQRKELEEQYKNIPDVNYSLSELMEKYVEQNTDSQWEDENELFKSLSIDEKSVRITNGDNRNSNNGRLKKQVSKSKLVKHITEADRSSHRSIMVEDQDKYRNLDTLKREMSELRSKRHTHYSTAYDSLQAEAYDTVEMEKIRQQRDRLELAHSAERILYEDETYMNAHGISMLEDSGPNDGSSEAPIETSLETVQRLEHICDILERCIVFLCAEFQKKKSYQEGQISDEVNIMHKMCLSCMRSLPIMRSRRVKRSWTKGAEIIFCWELNLQNPFSVHNEEHIQNLAQHYVEVHYEIDMLLEYFVELYRQKLKRDAIEDKRARDILQTVLTGEGASQEEEQIQAHIGRKKAMEALLPGLDMLSDWKDLNQLEDKIKKGEYQELKHIFFDRPSSQAAVFDVEDDNDGDSSISASKEYSQRDKLIQKKKLLFVINNYMYYCNRNIQSLFQKYVKKAKEDKLQQGYSSLETDFQRRRREAFRDPDQFPVDLNTERLIQRRKLGRPIGLDSGNDDLNGSIENNQSIDPDHQQSSLPALSSRRTLGDGSHVSTANTKSSFNNKTPTRKRVEEYVNIFDEWTMDWKEKFQKLDPKKKSHKVIQNFRKQKDLLLNRKAKDDSDGSEEDAPKSVDSQSDDRISRYMENDSLFKNSYQQDYERRQKLKQRQGSAQGRYPFSNKDEFKLYKKERKFQNRGNDVDLNEQKIGALRDENGVLLNAFQVLQLLEQVWDDLLLPYDKKIYLYEKYKSEPFTDVKKITEVYILWRRAANHVIEREVVLTKLREFEREASDPRRFFSGQSSIKRLQEEKKRSQLFKQVCKHARSVEREARKLQRDFHEELFYQSENYLEKMKSDYTNLLYLLERKRLRKTDYANFEELMEKLQEEQEKSLVDSNEP